MKIGFIGLGVMGSSMAHRVLQAGNELSVYTRTRSKAEALIREGAVWKNSVADVALDCELVCTMLGYPEDVREVYLGEGGLISHAGQGSLMIDFTTSSPRLAREIEQSGRSKGILVMDAPVSGGDVGAKNGGLSIMVGGSPEGFERAKPLFEELGKTIVYQGGAGKGQLTKLCNQIAIASTMVGVCESLFFAESNGLDPRQVLASIEHGAAGSWSLSNLAPRILDGDFQPGFYVHHFVKDMTLALEAAAEAGVQLPGLNLTLQRYQDLSAQGGDGLGTQGLYALYSEPS